MNSLNFISLFVLASVFLSVNSEKSCALYGTNEVMFLFGPFINVEDSEPKNYKELDELKKQCPNLSNKQLACCNSEQLLYIKGMTKIFFNTNRQECNNLYRDMLCAIHCSPNQKSYISVLDKSKSERKGKFNLSKLSAKIDLKTADKFYENCIDAKMGEKTIYELFKKPKSSPYLFKRLFVGTYTIDYRFYNKETNETFHMVKDGETFKKEPIVDTKEILPFNFRK